MEVFQQRFHLILPKYSKKIEEKFSENGSVNILGESSQMIQDESDDRTSYHYDLLENIPRGAHQMKPLVTHYYK